MPQLQEPEDSRHTQLTKPVVLELFDHCSQAVFVISSAKTWDMVVIVTWRIRRPNEIGLKKFARMM